MSKVAIVTDSTAYIPSALVEKYAIHVAPQILIWGSETLLDGIDIMPDEFYRRLQKASVMPSTSQVSPAEFEKMFRELLDQGYGVLAVLISAKLSGTINSAVQAKANLGDAPVEIVDSNFTAMAMGFQALTAARAAEAGADLAECKAIVEASRERCDVVLTVDTLEFLHRGGRIGGATRFLGTALNIKPILELVDGRIEPLERVRTRSKALARVLELAEERVGRQTPAHFAILHANAKAEAEDLLERARSRMNLVESYVTDVSPVIGANVGPGTLGICTMKDV